MMAPYSIDLIRSRDASAESTVAMCTSGILRRDVEASVSRRIGSSSMMRTRNMCRYYSQDRDAQPDTLSTLYTQSRARSANRELRLPSVPMQPNVPVCYVGGHTLAEQSSSAFLQVCPGNPSVGVRGRVVCSARVIAQPTRVSIL